MKKLKVYLSTAILLSFGYSFADMETDLKRCSMECSHYCADVIEQAKQLVKESSDNCENSGGDSAKTDCIKYVISAGQYPSTAKDTCANVDNSGQFECIKYVMSSGQYPSTAKDTCSDVVNEYTSDCISYVMSAGQYPSTAKDTCSFVKSSSQLECIKSVMGSGQYPSTAKSTCE